MEEVREFEREKTTERVCYRSSPVYVIFIIK